MTGANPATPLEHGRGLIEVFNRLPPLKIIRRIQQLICQRINNTITHRHLIWRALIILGVCPVRNVIALTHHHRVKGEARLPLLRLPL